MIMKRARVYNGHLVRLNYKANHSFHLQPFNSFYEMDCFERNEIHFVLLWHTMSVKNVQQKESKLCGIGQSVELS